MVGFFYRTVHRTVIRFKVFACQNIVYQEIEFILIIRDTQPEAGLGKRII